MGSDRTSGTRLAAARCCYGASFALGFVLTTLTIAAMFWIVWFYFGIAFIQFSDCQRRALVNYSHTTSKSSPISTTSSPNRSTPPLSITGVETAVNSISKSPTAATVLRGSSRGESQVKLDKRKDWAILSHNLNLAKGDFATRDRKHQNCTNRTLGGAVDKGSSAAFGIQDQTSAVTGPPHVASRTREGEKVGQKAAILSGSSSEVSVQDEDRIYARRVDASGPENRAEEPDKPDNRPPVRRNPPEAEASSRPDIAPTQVYYDYDARSKKPAEVDNNRPPREETRPATRDYEDKDRVSPVRRDDIQSSRRTEADPPYRDPDFERDYPRRYTTDAGRSRSRYDDIDDDQRSRSRYDKRDRGRDTDDRYSKGDSRVYPDDDDKSLERERVLRPDDRYRDRDLLDGRSRVRDDKYRDRYSDEPLRRGDDDRHRDRDYDDRYRDSDDRYRSRDTDVRSRDRIVEDRYPPREDDRYRVRDDDRYRTRDDEKYRSTDDRYRDRPIDDRPKSRAYDDTRYTDKTTDDKDSYRPRVDDDKYVERPLSRPRDRDYIDPLPRRRVDDDLVAERKPVRSEVDVRDDRRGVDYDREIRDRPRSYPRGDVPLRKTDIPARSVALDDEYKDRNDDYRRPSRIDDREERIAPTRTRDEAYISRSTLPDLRPRDDSRYVDDRRDARPRDDKYHYDDDRNVRIDDSRGTSLPSSGSSRKIVDPGEEYRTRLPDERRVDEKYVDRGDEVVLDRRSYASEEEDEYRRSNTRTRTPYDYSDRDRRPPETSRDYRDDDRYVRRGAVDDDDYKRSRTRGDYDADRSRYRDRYDDDYARDDRYVPRDDDRYISRDDRASPSRTHSRYPLDDDDRIRRRDPEERLRKDDSVRDDVRLRPPSRIDDERPLTKDTYISSRPSGNRRYDALPGPDSREDKDVYPLPPASSTRRGSGTSRQTSSAREPILGSPSYSEPDPVIIREKRYQDTQNKPVSGVRDTFRDRGDRDRFDDAAERPLSPKDVIEAALRHSDASDQNARKVYYPVFDPRVSNLTSPEIIRPSERRGTTITAKRRRRRANGM